MENLLMRRFSKYVGLNILGMLGLSCYILADTFFVAKALGSDGLAALNFSIVFYSVIHGAGLMIGIGGATKYVILKAQEKPIGANEIFFHSIFIGLFLGGIFFLMGRFFSAPIARLLGADSATFAMTNTYIKTILSFAPFFILNNIMIAFIRNDNNPHLSMAAMLIGSFSNVILDYLFMFPLSMGMFGAAIATSLAPIISLGVLSLHFINNRNLLKYKKFKIKIKNFFIIISFGISAFVTETSNGAALMIFNWTILGIAGNIGVAAYGIVANIALVIMAIFTGIAQGMQPLVSEEFAQGKLTELKTILKYGVVLTLIIGIAVYIFTLFFADQIITLFNKDNSIPLAQIAKKGFMIYFLGFFFAGYNVVVAAFLSATASRQKAFIISMVRGFFALIPLVYILSLLWGMTGVWLSFVIAELFTFIFFSTPAILKIKAIN